MNKTKCFYISAFLLLMTTASALAQGAYVFRVVRYVMSGAAAYGGAKAVVILTTPNQAKAKEEADKHPGAVVEKQPVEGAPPDVIKNDMEEDDR